MSVREQEDRWPSELRGVPAPEGRETAAETVSPDEAPPSEEGSPEDTGGVEPTSAEDEGQRKSEPGGVAEPAAEEEETTEPEAGSSEEKGSADAAPEPEASEAEEPSAPTQVAEEETEAQWYVLRVQSGREDTVSNNLRKKLTLTEMDHKVPSIVVPKQKVTEIKEGKRRVKAQKLYPGYIFVEAILDDELWYLIRDTSGIGDFVGSHRMPTPMTPSEVSKILDVMEEKEEIPAVKIDLVKNDQVKIKEGPFENFDGIVEEVNPAKGVVRVMVTIFGRETPVELEYWQVEKL